MSKRTDKEIEAEIQKLADKATELAKMLRANQAELIRGPGVPGLGRLIWAAQGHDYYEGIRVQHEEDSHEGDLSAEFSIEHECPVFVFYRMALEDDRRRAAMLVKYEFEPPTCPRPSFNPLTEEAHSYLPSVEVLLDALAHWFRTPFPFKRDDLRPRKVGSVGAERIFMARVLSGFFQERLGKRKHNLVAITLRVALELPEEDRFGVDHVRKAVKQRA